MAKQLCINKLPLCDDVLTIIKDYCFYDVQTAKTIKFIKRKKQEILQKFKNCYCTRKSSEGFYQEDDFELEDDEEDEHWAIGI